MPTINQLIKKNRARFTRKSKSIALTRTFNSVKNRPVFFPAPFKRGVCVKVARWVHLDTAVYTGPPRWAPGRG